MNTFDDSLEDVSLTVGGRRKRADKENHSKEVSKRARHSAGGKIPVISCNHSGDKGCCWADCLSSTDLALNQEKFYASCNKVRFFLYIFIIIIII